MLVSQLRYYGQNMRHSVLAIGNSSVYQIVHGINRKNYSNENKSDCCKNVPQTEGKRVESWPKSDPPPPAWRCECPRDPQPVNNDPYRIKVPDVVVPPLPPTNAKELPREDLHQMFKEPPLFNYAQETVEQCRTMLQNSIVYPEFWKNKGSKVSLVKEVLPKLGYHGRTKYKFAFHEPWKPLDRLSLLSQAEKEESVKGEGEISSKSDSERQKL